MGRYLTTFTETMRFILKLANLLLSKPFLVIFANWKAFRSIGLYKPRSNDL
jgi:hypothetical protein